MPPDGLIHDTAELAEEINTLLQGRPVSVGLSALALVMISMMEDPEAPPRCDFMDAALPHLKTLVGSFASLDTSVYG